MASFIVPNYGWVSKAMFFTDRRKALVLYAHKALFTVSCDSQSYNNGHIESEALDIDYDSLFIVTY